MSEVTDAVDPRSWRRRVTSWADEGEGSWLREAQQISRLGAYEIDLDAGVITVNRDLLDMFGVDESAFVSSGRSLLRQVHPEDRGRLEEAMDRIHTQGATVDERFRVRPPAGEEWRWHVMRSARGKDLAEPNRIVCAISDVDDLVRTELRLRTTHAELLQASRFQAAVIASTPDAIHVYDIATSSYVRASRAAAPLVGFTAQTAAVLSGERIDELLPWDDRQMLAESLRRACSMPDLETTTIRHRVVDPDHSRTLWLSRRVSVFDRDDAGRATSLLVVSTDITELIVAQQKLEHAAEHDDLTGLPNRRKFLHGLDTVLAESTPVAVLLVNLDGFKTLNESHGRAAGDDLLRAVARRLAGAIRRRDHVARVFGDEFVLLMVADGVQHGMDELDLELQADRVARRVHTLLSEPFYLGDFEITVTASIGISIAGSGGTTAEELLCAAEAAMNRVKHTGADGHGVFDLGLAQQARAHEHIERNLRRALRDDSLEVYYQPIVEPTTGGIRSGEALVRLRDEDGHMLPVDQLIAVAERCSLVAELDDQVLRKACSQVALWRTGSAYRDLRLTLNRSAKDLCRPGFYDRIMRRLLESDLPPEALTLEITETVLLQVTDARITEMARLRASAVHLAIDDFGTGYASMSQLVQLPISTIKIDRSFTARMLEDATCAALVRASVSIAADLQLACIVEGVETLAQLRALPKYERLYVQGFLYGRPRGFETALDLQLVSLT